MVTELESENQSNSGIRAEKHDTDYDVYLTKQVVLDALFNKVSKKWPVPLPDHPWSTKIVCNYGQTEVLRFGCTENKEILQNRKTHDGIYFDRDELGPIVQVYFSTLAALFQYKGREFIVTRYDGYEAKIWIRREREIEATNS